MPPSSKRPAPRRVGAYSLSVVRGPRADGRWYWRARHAQDVLWTGWATAAEAEREVIALAAAGGRPAEPEAPAVEEAETVKDLLELYLGALAEERGDLSANTHRIRRVCARHVARAIGEVRIARLDAAVLGDYRAQRLRAGAAPRSIQNEYVTLALAWRWARPIGIVPDRDIPRLTIKVSAKRVGETPTPGDVAAVLPLLPAWAQLATRLLYATGARLGELVALTVADVDLESGEVTLRGKTGRRTIPIGPETAALLAQAVEGLAPDARVVPVTPLTLRSSLRRWLAVSCQRAGVTAFSPQGLRRLTVDRLYEAGEDVAAAARLLGHSPEVALQHYRRVRPAQLREAIGRAGLDALPEGKVIELRRGTKGGTGR